MIGDKLNIPEQYKKYIVHDEMYVRGFFGEYRFLSNFYPAPTWYEGLLYPNSECAYQASKVLEQYRHKLQNCSAAESKKIWKTLPNAWSCAEAFDNAKYDIMRGIVFNKFSRSQELRKKLLDTGSRTLVETNWWGDVNYGIDIIKGGNNMLGKILMKVREFWRQ